MQTGWRLERSYLAGAGFPESRLEGLDINWSDPLEPTGHAALWADNGTGKTTITALRFALYLPNVRDFVRGNSDRSLAKLVYSGRVCHVVEQATRQVNGELQRIVVGMVADWVDGGAQDLDNPSKLHREFYGWVTGPQGPTISDLPFRTSVGRWATRAQFVEALREVLPDGGALPPHSPADHQTQWRLWLDAAGVDLEQIRFQAVMNASEGGVDRVMQFPDSDGFIRWLIGAITPTSTTEQIARGIDVLRANAAARPRWSDELALWERVIDPLLRLAIVHEDVGSNRRAVAIAETEAAAVVADADVTMAGLSAEKDTARARHTEHEQRRRDATATLRRAQAHRLRMQLRAAKLRVDAAEAAATQRRQARDKAGRELAAWQLVADVIDARAAMGQIAGLTERLDAAEKETAELRAEENRHRRDLARLLTDRRDRAASDHDTAQQELTTATNAFDAAEREFHKTLAAHATAVEQARKAHEDASKSEQVIAEAVTAGLLIEGTEPAAYDALLGTEVETARQAGEVARRALEDIDMRVSVEEQLLLAAQQREATARRDAADAWRRLREVSKRVHALAQDERLLEVVGDAGADPWITRMALTDALQRSAEAADGEATEARNAAAGAQRTVDAVGTEGLLPASALVEEAVRRCQGADLPVWPGWRWLADTMTPEAAAAFAEARPEIASGVVLAHAGLVDQACEVAGTVELDTAIWVGAVANTGVAMTAHDIDDGDDGTCGHVLLPHQGTFDRGAASEMVAAATEAVADATRHLQAATRRGANARGMLAALGQLWTDLPDDPRTELAEKIRTAQERLSDAETAARAAASRLNDLARQQSDHRRDRNAAEQVIGQATEARRLLAPAVAAAVVLATVSELLPELRRNISDTGRRIDELTEQKPQLVDDVAAALGLVRDNARRREDAAEALRAAGVSATTDGPMPADDEVTIRARLESVTAALQDTAMDPRLYEQLNQARRHLADLNARIDADTDLRHLTELFADSDGARHHVALGESVRQATAQEAQARGDCAKAEAAAEAASKEYRQRAEDRSTDRSSPDVDGFPQQRLVTTPADADRFAEQLDELATQLLTTQRAEERAATDAAQAAQDAEQSAKLVDASVNPLRYLTDTALVGRRAHNVDELIRRIAAVSERVRESSQALSKSEREQEAIAGAVRAHANGPQARKVEESEDPRVVDLILRLRADQRLAAEAERIAEQLEQRATSLRDDLERHDQHVRTCANMLHVQAATAIQRLRAYQNQSLLPEGLGKWSQRRFVVIDHEPTPADESVAIDRVARVVHALLTPGAAHSDAQSLLFAAARALVDAPFRVRLLKPHTDLSLDRVDVAELKNFSCGQRVTAGVLLYATMTRVRATGDATSAGWLWLDNPFGQASADQFVRTMRRAADQLGLQLLFTAAPKDKGALSMFDRTITLARRSRPSSKERIVVVDDGTREISHLLLVQKDVTAVLGG